jgi:hypothetical protein
MTPICNDTPLCVEKISPVTGQRKPDVTYAPRNLLQRFLRSCRSRVAARGHILLLIMIARALGNGGNPYQISCGDPSRM